MFVSLYLRCKQFSPNLHLSRMSQSSLAIADEYLFSLTFLNSQVYALLGPKHINNYGFMLGISGRALT